MKKKERTLTLYFDADDPVYNKLMNMNKFSRAEYIRTALREAVSKGMMMTVSTDGISVVYSEAGSEKVYTKKQVSVEHIISEESVKVSDIEAVQSKPNSIIPDNTEMVVLEENTDPFAI